jgi:methionine-gamma-lyase
MNKEGLATKLIHTGGGNNNKRLLQTASVPEVMPIYMTSVFAFDDVPSVDAIYESRADGYVYSRMSNPSTDNTAQILAAAEEGDDALLFSSGMAAIIAVILANVQGGDHILASPVLYGGVHDFLANELKRFNIEVSFVDFINDNLEKYIRPNTKIIYTETISNPLMEVVDIEQAAEIAHKYNLKMIVDNTFATSIVAKVLSLGADIVVYSVTKYLGGHSDIVGGAVISNKENIKQIKRIQTLYGAIMSPFDSWLLARSLRTLDLRVKKHSENAIKVARFLENHPKIEKVFYPGLESSSSYDRAKKLFKNDCFGGMLSANLIGGEKEASALVEKCESIKFVPSLAGVVTSISYAAKTSHRSYSKDEMDKAGITLGQLRFSIGLEDADDIIRELSNALEFV